MSFFLLALAAIAGCSSDPEPEIGVEAYETVLERFVPTPAADGEPLAIVYVAMIAPAELSLEDQVAIIDGFAATHEVRFVDDMEAAIDVDLPDSPPRDDATLLGVGRISSSRPHVVRVEEYVDIERTEAWRTTMTMRADRWVVDAVEAVEPEVVLVEDQ